MLVADGAVVKVGTPLYTVRAQDGTLTTVTAPWQASVVNLLVAPGNYVTPGSPIATFEPVAGPGDQLVAAVFVLERAVQLLHVGETVSVDVPAALGIILAHHGRRIPLEQLRRDCGVSRDGASAGTIVKAARGYGLTGKGLQLDLADLPKLPLPAILFWQFNHYLVLEGYNRRKVWVNDPGTGPRKVSWKEFDESFTGVALTLSPGDEFVRGGRRPSLLGALLERRPHLGSALYLAVLLGAVVRTFFNYFASKEELLFPESDARVQAAIEAIAGRGPQDGPADVLLRALRTVGATGDPSGDEMAGGLAELRLRLIRTVPAVRGRALQLQLEAQREIARHLFQAFPATLDEVSAAAVTGAFIGAITAALQVLVENSDRPDDPAEFHRVLRQATDLALAPWSA